MLTRILTLIRFTHTIFALPFALGSMLVAARGLPAPRTALLILACMVTARTAAMAFNRWADWETDKRNPRTAGRHKLVSKNTALALTLAASALFLLSAALINQICLLLSPLALALALFYSLTKRFTHLAQLFLGLALSVAPVGAWLAVTGSWAWTPCVLASAVICWVAGFDLIYATQDHEFDRKEGLKSMVVWLGVPRALIAARILHTATWILLAAFGIVAQLGAPYWIGLAAILPILLWEHHIAARRDLQAINLAFFQANALVGLLFLASLLADQVLLPATVNTPPQPSHQVTSNLRNQ